MMVNLSRSKLWAAAILFVLTVAACCSPAQARVGCPGRSGETMPQTGADMDMDQSMDGMGMLSAPTGACPLVYLTENDPEPPLYPDIGNAHWPVPWAQDYFDQGLRFFFGFNNRESYRAFHKAANEAEKNGIPCSACYWAQALALGIDLNMGKELEPDRREANAMLHRAAQANPTPKDWEIIRALFGRYQDCNGENEKKCQRVRNQSYYDGMKRVLQMFGSDDPDVITLFADSAMNLTPWAYWEKNGNPVPDSIEPITEARTYLEKALKFGEYPQNEGPIHWYIHLMEQSPTPDAAREYADLLSPIAPNSGHLVHMSSHISYRMGDMQNAIRVNKEAIEADEKYFGTEPNLYRPDGDRYKYGYYPHNIHFVLVAAMLSGDNNERDVNRYAEKLFKSAPDNANGYRADIYRAVYYLAKMNFSSAADIREFAPPNLFYQQPLANVAYDFTQLMANIWDGKDSTQSAGKFDVDLAKYRKKTPKPNASCDTSAPGLPLPGDLCLAAILDNLRHARVGVSNTNWDEAVAAAQRAIDIQDALPYDEPPLWPYPARQTLASVWIRRAEADGPTTDRGRQDLATAKQLLLKSLNKASDDNPNQIPTGTYPGNGWAYYGLWEIAKRDGSSSADIDNAWADLNDHWFGTAEFQRLDRL
jgi:hypothetical protein